MKILGIGLDLGSTTAKFAVVDSEGKILESDYRRHGAAVKETALTLLKELQVKYPDTAFELMLTGSAALDLAVSAGAGFIQEVIASSRAIKLVAPDTDVAIELGGEDAKILYLSDGMELRMNEVCAGGTGRSSTRWRHSSIRTRQGSINSRPTRRRSIPLRPAAACSRRRTLCLF